jgi:hypothetical protein
VLHALARGFKLIHRCVKPLFCVLANLFCIHGFLTSLLNLNADRSSGRAPDAPKHPRARPIHLSSLYEILFRPENNRIAPLTNIAPPAAELTGEPRPGAAA